LDFITQLLIPLGFRYKARLISGQVWKPFDERFSKVLNRLQTHKNVFESGLNLIYSQELIMHFTFMEREIWSNEARQEQDQLRENKQSVRRSSLIPSHAIPRDPSVSEVEANLATFPEQRIRDIENWIGAPNWMDRLEEAQQRRTGNSGKWLLQSEAYRTWLSQPVFQASGGAPSYSNFLAITGMRFLSVVLLRLTLSKGNQVTARQYSHRI
jgi:hypothetical protein